MLKSGGLNSPDVLPPMLVGTATSFFVGCFALRWLLAFLARGRLHWFAIYCFVLGSASALWQWAT
jgi:undecaprenyl pyrophosphate phosphatase UppP